MVSISSFYKTTIGKKVVVAITGLVLFLFLIAHMAGNLKGLFGFDAQTGLHKLDLYAKFLREVGSDVVGPSGVLWLTRIVLLICLVFHVITVVQLRSLNKRSRLEGYQGLTRPSSPLASRSMWWGGLLLLAFVIYHLQHLTIGNLHFEGFEEGKVYANVYSTFQRWPVFLIYVGAMIALAAHLHHGVWSLFQTLGLDNPQRNVCLRTLAAVAAVTISVGFLFLPVGAFMKILPEPTSHYSEHTAVHFADQPQAAHGSLPVGGVKQ